MSGPMAAPTGDSAGGIPGRVADAVVEVDGLSLLVPLRARALRWTGSDAALAVTADSDGIEVRMVAHRLPLPPLLEQAAAGVRAALAGTGWEHVRLRLVVAELTAEAFSED